LTAFKANTRSPFSKSKTLLRFDQNFGKRNIQKLFWEWEISSNAKPQSRKGKSALRHQVDLTAIRRLEQKLICRRRREESHPENPNLK
jgi:hypothetical protein